jgi:hypothetical protein
MCTQDFMQLQSNTRFQANVRTNSTLSLNLTGKTRRHRPAALLSPSELRRIVAEMLD